MATIDTLRQIELQHLVTEIRRAARTVRSQTRLERDEVRRALVAALRDDLEALAAIHAWATGLEAADAGDADLLQELLYGIDALVRVHLWREAGLPLTTPETAII
jgi:acyl-CoA reductase-like NAD-dependent aldehyde dehydrogenase